MNVQENVQIPAEFEIHALPALALHRHGRFKRFIGGLGKKSDILRQLNVRKPNTPSTSSSSG
ncbi:MAG: hypothetical protein HZB35_04535 [Nitrospirae bacterium]|nr:hypothetical protein [Nitrospirota bacterium]